MSWFIFAFLAAFFESMKDVFSKKGLKNMNEYLTTWALLVFAIPFPLAILFYSGIPSFKNINMFLLALVVSGSLNIITAILYMKALKQSDLSIAVPFISFTPLFIILISPFILGEFSGIPGFIGILLIAIGSFILNIKTRHKGYFMSFKILFKEEKGVKLMLSVAFIWALTGNFDKIGVLNSSPIFWVFATNLFRAAVMSTIILFHQQKENLKQIPLSLKTLAPIGIFSGLTQIFQMTAISLTLVAYVISIKRTSIIMSVLFGYLIFKEKSIKERLIGSIIMFFGILFIALS